MSPPPREEELVMPTEDEDKRVSVLREAVRPDELEEEQKSCCPVLQVAESGRRRVEREGSAEEEVKEYDDEEENEKGVEEEVETEEAGDPETFRDGAASSKLRESCGGAE